MEIKNEGYLQEIAFNYNGDKMAICSSSHEITIYYKKETIEMLFSNVLLPEKRWKDTIKINHHFWENNKLVNVYSNNEHILNILAPILNADIELNNCII